jgi:SepF-like predicted cell division protein (DUF552 family)
MVFGFKSWFNKEDQGEDYLEIDVNSAEPKANRVTVKPFLLREFSDINGILESLRNGYTIAVIDIKPLKTKDVIELKRAVAKIKKTVDALKGSIAGFGEHTIIATPEFAEIQRAQSQEKKEKSDFLN